MAGGSGTQSGASPAAAAPKTVTGAVDKQNPHVYKPIVLKVWVRTDFLVRDPFLLPPPNAAGKRQLHWGGEAVANATVTLPGADPVQTRADGMATLDVTGVTDGNYTLRISMDTPMASTDDEAGPALARNLPSPSPPARIYRPLSVPVTLIGGKFKIAVDPYNPDIAATWGRLGHSKQDDMTEDILPIDWRPVWIKSPRERTLRNALDVKMIICHCTGGWQVGDAINTFIAPGKTHPWDFDSAHYLIDHDGHIIKFCREDHLVDHAGIRVLWDGLRTVNPISIGIEMVHHSKDFKHPEPEVAYNKYQIQALIRLLAALQGDATMSIPSHRIAGHSDVDMVQNYSTNKETHVTVPTSLGSRDTDPGQKFPWELVEAAGLGMIPQDGVDMTNAYSGFFTQFPAESLKNGDNDSKKRWGGGLKTKGIPIADTPAPVRELQDDLGKIGYTAIGVAADGGGAASDAAGVFGKFTVYQVTRFQRHFFSFNRTHSANGVVDLKTATMIKAVAAGIP